MYQKINKVLTGDKSIMQIMSTVPTAVAAAGTIGVAAKKARMGRGRLMSDAVRNVNRLGVKKGLKTSAKSMGRAFKKAWSAKSAMALLSLGLFGLQAITTGVSMAQADKRKADTLYKMVMSGDIDVSDLFSYAYTSTSKKEKKIITTTLSRLGYKGQPVAQFTGSVRSNRANAYMQGGKIK